MSKECNSTRAQTFAPPPPQAFIDSCRNAAPSLLPSSVRENESGDGGVARGGVSDSVGLKLTADSHFRFMDELRNFDVNKLNYVNYLTISFTKFVIRFPASFALSVYNS